MAEGRYDFIIVGSGSSGGVAAHILQKSGAKCLLLEAGRWFRKEDFPLPEIQYTPNLYWGGGVEYNTSASLALLRGKCVGGGSIINGALMDRFDKVALDDFRAESGVDFFTEEALDPHYAFAESGMVLQTIPDEHRNNNAHLFMKGMDNVGHKWSSLRRCQSDCAIEEGNDCIACLGGCHRGSKQSTMETHIKLAVELGLEVWEQAMVTQIEHQASGVRVHVERKGAKKILDAPKVILAAGAMGTTQLLLNSGFKQKLPALGTKFCIHPQYMHFAIFDEQVDAHKGVLQGVKSSDPDFRRRGFKLENVFAPPISTAVVTGLLGADSQEFMSKYRHLACIEVATRDENTGVIATDAKGKLKVHKELTDQDRRRVNDGAKTIHDLFASLKPRKILNTSFGFGLHVMGGCAIGVEPKTSVVNEAFQVHDHPNISIADISINPNAPGINPALTVMALTHRMASALVK